MVSRTLLVTLLSVAGPAAASAEVACFAYDTGTARAVLAMDVPDGDGPVVGAEEGEVQDAEQGYFTSWSSTFEGTISGDTLSVTVETAIEDDVQSEEQSWTLDGSTLVTDRATYEAVDCPPADEEPGMDEGDAGAGTAASD